MNLVWAGNSGALVRAQLGVQHSCMLHRRGAIQPPPHRPPPLPPSTDMVAVLNGRLPPELHSCTVPALPAGRVLGYANTPGAPMHAALRACRLAPLPADRNMVFGAIAPRWGEGAMRNPGWPPLGALLWWWVLLGFGLRPMPSPAYPLPTPPLPPPLARSPLAQPAVGEHPRPCRPAWHAGLQVCFCPNCGHVRGPQPLQRQPVPWSGGHGAHRAHAGGRCAGPRDAGLGGKGRQLSSAAAVCA